jgi:chorismate mutase
MASPKASIPRKASYTTKGRNYAKYITQVLPSAKTAILYQNDELGKDFVVDPISNLRDIRDSIDNIDAAIIHMLAERFRCTRAVGKLKARHGLPPSDTVREAEQVSRLRQLAAASKLDPDFAERLM